MRYNPILKPCKLLQQPHGFPPGGEGGTEQSSMGGSWPQGPTPYPAMKYHFDRKGTPFIYLLLTNIVPLSHT